MVRGRLWNSSLRTHRFALFKDPHMFLSTSPLQELSVRGHVMSRQSDRMHFNHVDKLAIRPQLSCQQQTSHRTRDQKLETSLTMSIHTQITNVSEGCNKVIPPAWILEPRDIIDDAVEIAVWRKLGDHGRKRLAERLDIVVPNTVAELMKRPQTFPKTVMHLQVLQAAHLLRVSWLGQPECKPSTKAKDMKIQKIRRTRRRMAIESLEIRSGFPSSFLVCLCHYQATN